jgi:hypothetical protein
MKENCGEEEVESSIEENSRKSKITVKKEY